ncbi:hypothetical protein [Crossiella sp. CA198]|uniref:hypothetical protein n=1 Tax=Crossiella sp. CA198 TaxID=3455607 RepID=UPI003F8D7B97
MATRTELIADLLRLGAELLTAHPDAPPVACVSSTGSCFDTARVQLQLPSQSDLHAECAAIAEWATLLKLPVPLRDCGSYLAAEIEWVMHTPAGHPVQVQIWNYFRQTQRHDLIRAVGVAFTDGKATVSAEQLRAALAEIEPKAEVA